MPKVTQLDADGTPLSDPYDTSLAVRVVDVETIQWTAWTSGRARALDAMKATSLFASGTRMLNAKLVDLPIVLLLKGKALCCKATRAIATGELVVPLHINSTAP